MRELTKPLIITPHFDHSASQQKKPTHTKLTGRIRVQRVAHRIRHQNHLGQQLKAAALMNVLHRLDRYRAEIVEHRKVHRMQQLHQQRRRHRNARQRFRRQQRAGRTAAAAAAGRIAAVRGAVRMAGPAEALRGQLRGAAAQVPQGGLLDDGQLLIVGEQQCRHHGQAILRVQRFDRLPGAPRHVLVAVLLPAPQIARVQRLGLVVDGRLGEHRHPEGDRALLLTAAAAVHAVAAVVLVLLGRLSAAVTVHLHVVHADEQRFDAAAALLVALRDAVQVRIHQAGQELQSEFAQADNNDIGTAIERAQLLANGVQQLQESREIITDNYAPAITSSQYTYVHIFDALVDDGEQGLSDLVIVLDFSGKGAQFGRLQGRIVGQPIADERLGHNVVGFGLNLEKSESVQHTHNIHTCLQFIDFTRVHFHFQCRAVSVFYALQMHLHHQ